MCLTLAVARNNQKEIHTMQSIQEIKRRLEQDRRDLKIAQSTGEESHEEHNIIGWIEALEWVISK
jgi:SOS-response transcriptional repressor LexA